MSRIRTIKPEFFSSEQIASCSRDARLLFIGMWNFCDDAGIHPASYMRIKMEVLPADSCSVDDVKQWVDELIQNNLLREYIADKKSYWQVTGWHHQKIDKPTYRFPKPRAELKNITDNSSVIRRALDDYSTNDTPTKEGSSSTIRRQLVESSGTEGKVMEGIKISSLREEVVSVAADLSQQEISTLQNQAPTRLCKQSSSPSCPHAEIVSLYHELLPMCPPVRIWNKTRRGYLKQRWSEDARHQSLSFWEKFFKHVSTSQFLIGQVAGSGERPPFVATLEWLVKPSNFVKVLEGKYHA